jgi:hypothetical protein
MMNIASSDVYTGDLLEDEPYGKFLSSDEMEGTAFDAGEFGQWVNMGYQYNFPPTTTSVEYLTALNKA